MLAGKLLHFVSLTDYLIYLITDYHVRCKTIVTSILHVNNNSFTGPFNYRDFRETGPRGALKLRRFLVPTYS